jgi:hypothetical protein
MVILAGVFSASALLVWLRSASAPVTLTALTRIPGIVGVTSSVTVAAPWLLKSPSWQVTALVP